MKLIIKRTLNNYDGWKKIVSENTQDRADSGSQGMTVYRLKDKPNDVIGVLDWDDNKPYQDYFNSPENKKLIESTGTMEVLEVSDSFSLDA